jgi:hypothetical protein
MNTFARLDREYVGYSLTPVDALGRLAIESLAGYFRSHPLTSERLAQLQKVVVQSGLSSSQSTVPFRPEILAALRQISAGVTKSRRDAVRVSNQLPAATTFRSVGLPVRIGTGQCENLKRPGYPQHLGLASADGLNI